MMTTHRRQGILPDTTQHIQLVDGLMVAPSTCKGTDIEFSIGSLAVANARLADDKARTLASRTPVHAHRFELPLLHRRWGLRAHKNLETNTIAVRWRLEALRGHTGPPYDVEPRDHILQTARQLPASARAIERRVGATHAPGLSQLTSCNVSYLPQAWLRSPIGGGCSVDRRMTLFRPPVGDMMSNCSVGEFRRDARLSPVPGPIETVDMTAAEEHPKHELVIARSPVLS